MGLITITSILGGLTCTQAYIIRNSSSTSVQRPPPSPRLISLSEVAAFDDPRVWHRALNDAPASNPPFANSTSPRSSVADSFGNLTIKTSIAPGATIQIPPPLGSNTPHTTGTVYTELDVKGKATQAPLLSQHISSPSSILTATGTATSVAASSPPLRTMVSNDIFAEPIDTKAPPSNIAVRQDHPVPRKGIQTKAPLQTNKFYSNFFLGDQLGPTYTFPYSVQWAGERARARAGACHVRTLTLTNESLARRSSMEQCLTTSILPACTSKTMSRITREPKEQVTKYTFNLEDGTTWRVYAWKSKGDDLDLEVINNGLAQSRKPFHGIVQVCKDPGTPDSEKMLDDGAGIYPVAVALSGSASGATGNYSFKFQKEGHQAGDLYMYALPHHVDSFNSETKQRVQKTQLQSTTKGTATLVKGTEWTMVEPHMPVDIGFDPWHPEKGNISHLSDKAKSTIRAAAAKEVSQDMISQSNLDSMYFSGKALAKFATILYVINNLIGDKALAQTGLGQLKAAFATFAANKQKFPLTHETAWGGVVSSASYVTGDAGVDFGNTYYNDHHFHYGYHILAAATIGQLDPEWAKANADYVNTLVRDVANPSAKDGFFPMWRNFDWYHGHSWAHGLYAAMDGKDQESSSEDMMHAYALKMWGKVTGNADLEARSNLQLAIISRSLQSYYLYRDDNSVQPKQFIGNKVAGILFENKVDHTTYFDPHIEAIQGIHMIPILPPTPFVRVSDFVREEWDAFFSNGRIDNIRNAWKGIIYASYATVDPKKAWEFFTSKTFDPQWLDGGASLTWFMAYAAALGDI
ncbi:hypothetical protein ACCO45_009299 [Purpureocillium lilacinum]|uniref:Uncharacterized protein n=1 Tax=Purpureocillium lilacinum TaxID=33203 RepID=A0ACC4DMC9_PURLI